jgi:hypothetical protein
MGFTNIQMCFFISYCILIVNFIIPKDFYAKLNQRNIFFSQGKDEELNHIPMACLLLQIFLCEPNIIFGPVFGGQVTPGVVLSERITYLVSSWKGAVHIVTIILS